MGFGFGQVDKIPSVLPIRVPHYPRFHLLSVSFPLDSAFLTLNSTPYVLCNPIQISLFLHICFLLLGLETAAQVQIVHGYPLPRHRRAGRYIAKRRLAKILPFRV